MSGVTGKAAARMAAIATLGIAASVNGAPAPEAPLLRDVTRLGYEEGKALIERRVREAYPIGSSDAGLLNYLTSQGLAGTRRIVPGNVDNPVFGQTRLTLNRTACNAVVGVDWRADAAGRITEIVAIYSDTGCL